MSTHFKEARKRQAAQPSVPAYLVRELRWFNAHRRALLKAGRGKWAAVHNQELVGVFDTFAEAYRAASAEAKSGKVLVKQILEKDEPIALSVNYSLGLRNSSTTARRPRSA